MNMFVKPTLRRNNVTLSCCKFITGDLENCKISLNAQKCVKNFINSLII